MMEIQNPKVSVISVFYNRGYCVKDSVQSILDQTFTDFELVLVDDGSSDSTLSKFKEFSDPRIRILTHENIGFTNSIIRAVKLAKGKYIAIHGSGDFSLPDRIMKQVSVLERLSKVTVVGSHIKIVNPGSSKFKVKMPDEYYNREILFTKNPIEHGAAMFRKSDYKEVGGYRSQILYSQDLDLWLRLTLLGNIKIINEVLYFSQVLTDGVTYFPKKAIKQYQYAFLIRKLAQLSSEDELSLLKQLDENGIDFVVPKSSSFVQSKLFKKFNSLILTKKEIDIIDFCENSPSYFVFYYKLVYYLSSSDWFMSMFKYLHNIVYLKLIKRKFKTLQSS